MKFELIDNCPVPARLAPCVREIKRRTGATLNSCDRSKEAEPFLRRCKPRKMSQRELYEGFVRGLAGFNPANPPGFSTHERRNDGVAFRGPRGMPLFYWQVGMDWSNSAAVVQAANKLGFTATRTYPNNARETHHLNFRREPILNVLPLLKRGSKGYRVARMAHMLASVRDADGRPYLDKGQGIFDEKVEAAVRRFQREWDQKVDGVYGPQTARQLAVAMRAAKKDPAARARPRRRAAAAGALAAKVAKAKPKRGKAKPTALSPAGAQFIAEFEGFRANLYNDAAGHCTIGYGHLVHHGPINGSEPAEFRRGITRARALELLRADAATAAAEVRRSVKVPLTQPQFDALVSFAFNVGCGAFRESTLVRLLNAGDYACVPKQLARWTKAGGRPLEGLVRRRAAEAALFVRGLY